MRRLAVVVATLVTIACGAGSAAAYTVPGKLTASFTHAPGKAYAGHAVAFDGSGSTAAAGDSIVAYDWTFGDGATATTSTPTVSHTYAASGSYTITLVVADPSGDTSPPDSSTLKVHSDRPRAKFARAHKHINVNQTDSFDATKSSDPDGDAIVSYQWGFGDGTGTTTTTPAAQHAYSSPGSYSVTLSVTDSLGATSSTTSHKVIVTAPESSSTPIARFAVSPRHPRVGESVQFDAGGSSAASGRSLVAYEWTFGDGTKTVTTAALTQHTFAKAGDFIAQLVVVDNHGKHSEEALEAVRVGHSVRLFRVRLRACRRHRPGCRHAGLAVRFSLSHADRVVLTIRRHRRGRDLVRRIVFAHRGRNRVLLRFHGAAHRRYTLTLEPDGGRTVAVRFRWRR